MTVSVALTPRWDINSEDDRWRSTSSRPDDEQYLGGTERYDLWLVEYKPTVKATKYKLRAVWRDRYCVNWDHYVPNVGWQYCEDETPKAAAWADIVQYLRVFAPDAARALDMMED